MSPEKASTDRSTQRNSIGNLCFSPSLYYT